MLISILACSSPSLQARKLPSDTHDLFVPGKSAVINLSPAKNARFIALKENRRPSVPFIRGSRYAALRYELC
jgi:hypothetical protein